MKPLWLIVPLLFFCFSGCEKVKETFTNPPSGDSWADYHQYQDCIKELDKRTTGPIVSEHNGVIVRDMGECAE